MIIVDIVTDAKAASALLPKQMTTYPIPEMPGKALMKLLFADYRKVSKLGPYKEAVVQIAALHDGELSLYIPFIYLTTDSAIAAGQEIGGYPKKIASIVMQRYGNDLRGLPRARGKTDHLAEQPPRLATALDAVAGGQAGALAVHAST